MGRGQQNKIKKGLIIIVTLFPFPIAQMFASFLSPPSLMKISAGTALLK